LNGRDEVILDALFPKSAPTSALKAVLNGRLAKVALLEPLATLSVTMSLLTSRQTTTSMTECVTR
jgi:hypothetical protein